MSGCLTTAGKGSSCADCHGSPDTNWAPPKALGGETDPSYIGVGSHQAHVTGSKLGTPVECSECHVVPKQLRSEGHVDDEWPSEVVWGELTRSGEADRQVVWDRQTQTCSNSYCHAGEGAAVPTPVWNDFGAATTACDGCHGDPPPPPHPSGPCVDCHKPTAQEGGGLSPATHMDGRVTLGFSRPTGDDTGTTVVGCEGCHGDETSLAPPPDTSGRTETSERTVGAHRIHVDGTNSAAAVACEDCHVVPAQTNDPNHLDAAPAEVTFAGRALPSAATPTWKGTSHTCSNTYCHGADSSGGTHTEPVWTTVDGTQGRCGSCHGMPPTVNHPPSSACENCHGSVAGPGAAIIDPSAHINGVTDF